MSERPERVTVVSWLLLVFSAFGLLSLMLTFPMLKGMGSDPSMQPFIQAYLDRIPVPLPVHFALLGVAAAIPPFCAVGFLRRWGWTRTLYVSVAFLGGAYGIYINPYSLWFMLPGLLLPIGVLYCVYSTPARNWFAGKDSAAEAAAG